MRWLLPLILAAAPALADGEKAGDFDYYVLSLTWSPGWCAIEGDAKGADQCDPRHEHTFLLHGLWPQYEVGWPSFCRTTAPAPSRTATAGMTDVMGSAGLAWYEWRKHGTCSGLDPSGYFELSRAAYEGIAIPDVLKAVKRRLAVDPAVIEAALVEANPGLAPSMVTITCDRGRISEARICLTKDLSFRPCGPDAARDCRMKGAILEPVR